MHDNPPHFLQQVVSHLLTHHREELGEMRLVFPNKRAGLFFQKVLSETIDQPLFSPEVLTIQELFHQHSSLVMADPLTLNFELFQVFKNEVGTDEGFDKFFFWGEMLLRDFDEIDKYLVKSQDLFQVILQEKEIIQHFDYLTPEQISLIQQFWASFRPPVSDEQDHFVAIWESLLPIYLQFSETLRQKGMAYEGMIYREVAQHCVDRMDAERKTVFIGFHLLTHCEERVFDFYKNNKNGLFFWDVDNWYMQDDVHEAGRFLRRYVQRYPSPLEPRKRLGNQENTKLQIWSIPLHIGQTWSVHHILSQLGAVKEETAIVLPDEQLLMPVLHAIPATVPDVNVTMGYPLRNTPVYSLLLSLLDMQRYATQKNNQTVWYYKPVVQLLNHPYLQGNNRKEMENLLKTIREENRIYIDPTALPEQPPICTYLFKAYTDVENWLQYLLDIFEFLSIKHDENISDTSDENAEQAHTPSLDREFLGAMYVKLYRLKDIIVEKHIQFEFNTFQRLIRQIAESIRVPFSGEPLRGLQVMGLLETRNLDFKNVLFLNMNESIFPGDQHQGSFIPYHLRKAFELPILEHQQSLSAYYFYRLLHTAQNVYLLHNSITEGRSDGEESRFIMQLRSEGVIKDISHVTQTQIAIPAQRKPITIQRTPELWERLLRYTNAIPGAEKRLTPSALNYYLDCRLKFYFRYIANIYERTDMTETVDAASFGNLLHYTMENLYRALHNHKNSAEVTTNDFTFLNDHLAKAIRQAFVEVMMRTKEDRFFAFEGEHLVVRDVVLNYSQQILAADEAHAPFTIVSLETDTTYPFTIQRDGQPLQVRIGGIIDRLDQKNGTLRILDYKTGSDDHKRVFTGISSLFDRTDTKRKSQAFQVMAYALIKNEEHQAQVPITPGLLFVRELAQGRISTHLSIKEEKDITPVADYRPYHIDFKQGMHNLLSELMASEHPFDQTEHEEHCRICPYQHICHKDI